MTDVTERRPGRPRSEDADRAIEAAALELLVEDGFTGMSIDRLAARAGVGKATIYRRWPEKSDLVVDAVTHRCAEHVVEPDTGSLTGDMQVLLHALVHKFQRDGEVLRAFAAAQAFHPELGEIFRARFLADRRASTRAVLERAIARGELPPDSDIELLSDVGPALLWHRLSISDAPIDDGVADRIITQFFSPAPDRESR